MSIQDITEYVRKTPENTNPSVIKSMIEREIGDSSKDVVKYTPQSLTEEQQAQARNNIGAVTLSELEAKFFPLIEIKTKLKLNETVMLSEEECEHLEGVNASVRLPRLVFAIDDLGGCITIPTAIDQVFLVTIIVGADIVTIIFDRTKEDLWSATASVFSMAPTE